MFVEDNLNFKINKIYYLFNSIKTVPKGLSFVDLKESNINILLKFNAKLKAQQLKSVVEQIISNNYGDVFLEY